MQTLKAFLLDLTQNWHYSYFRMASKVTQEEWQKVTDDIMP